MARPPMHPDPIRLSVLMERGGRSTRRAAPGKAQRLASALNVTAERARAYKRGDDPHTPAVKLFVPIDRLMRGEGTSAFPILMEAWAVAMDALSDRPTPELEARIEKWLDRRRGLRADLDNAHLEERRAGKRYGTGAVYRATIALNEVELEIAAMREILRQREERGEL